MLTAVSRGPELVRHTGPSASTSRRLLNSRGRIEIPISYGVAFQSPPLPFLCPNPFGQTSTNHHPPPTTHHQTMARLLFLLAVLAGLLSPVVYFLEQRLQDFYIFSPDQLHGLAKQGIAAHGNDTRSVVNYIVHELHSDAATSNHVNVDEEWIFNNAGGAMGAMYIIHASML